MNFTFLLLLPLIFFGSASGGIFAKAKVEPEKLEVPLLDYDNLTVSQTAWEHFGNRTAWQRCQDLYPLLAVGDLIELVGVVPVQVLDDFEFQHWAIYAGERNGVHFIVNYHLAPPEKGIIREEPLNDDFRNRTCRINNRQAWIDAPFLPWMSIARARSVIGQKLYNLHDNNCEHLVKWSRNGARKSLQIIKRGKKDRVKRFEKWIEDGVEIAKDTVVDGYKSAVGTVKAGVVYVANTVANNHIEKHYTDPCEDLDNDFERYRVLLKEDDSTPMGKSPFNETQPKDYRYDTVILGEYFCPNKNKHAAQSRESSQSRRRKRDRIRDFARKCKNAVSGSHSGSSSDSSGGPRSSGSEDNQTDKTATSTLATPKKGECRPPICRIPLKEHDDLGLSFAGCGFLALYHFGVIKCFMTNGKTLMSRLRRVSGASAGSLVAAILVLAPEQLDASMEALYDMGDRINSMPLGALTPGFYLGQKLAEIVDRFIPADISHGNHRLFISLTHHKKRENRLVSEYPSRAYLIKCLEGSCFIPVYSAGIAAPVPEIDGQPYVDGGYTNNLPDYSDLRTITVSPFGCDCDITPPAGKVVFDWKMTIANQHMKVNLRNIKRGAQTLFPPSRVTLKHFYNQGYRDAFKFLLANDMLERDAGSEV